MTNFVLRNNLYLMAGARCRRRQLCRFELVFDAPAAANGRVILCWACDAPMGRGPFPRRGFVELITEHLHFTASSRYFGEIVTAAYVLVILPSGLEPAAIHGLAGRGHRRHRRPISEPNGLPTHPRGRYH